MQREGVSGAEAAGGEAQELPSRPGGRIRRALCGLRKNYKSSVRRRRVQERQRPHKVGRWGWMVGPPGFEPGTGRL
jgi:hypothetical protein